MPKLIDHDLRRAELAEAAWRVIARDGVGAVSVRSVAAEAGVSAGSLRHVLPTKESMLAAAMNLVLERGTERFLARAAQPLRTRADAVDLLGEMLPYDDERRLELRTHLALVLESAAHPGLSHLRSALDDAVRAGCTIVLAACVDAGLLRPAVDPEAETEHLHLLVDGLALHLLGPDQRITPDRARRLLEQHLASLG